MPEENAPVEAQVARFQKNAEALAEEIAREIVGHRDLVRFILVTLLSGGHALIEGVPGLGKTRLVRALSRSLELSYQRIQFTPDLMPADITGTNIVTETEQGVRSFTFQKGPVFASIVLADEINRATPKTQSALLEAMQESAVTVAGTRHELPSPFMVLATQNPIEMEGTYPLPEAQMDRFLLKLDVGFPGRDDLVEIFDRTTGASDAQAKPVIRAEEVGKMRSLVREVLIASHLRDYVARVVLATHPRSPDSPEQVKKYVRYGSSPRGGQAAVLGAKALALLEGRYNASLADIQECMLPALRHRIILNFEGEAEGISTDEIVRQVLETVRARPEEVADLGL
jgi:MoxR-like ATPase